MRKMNIKNFFAVSIMCCGIGTTLTSCTDMFETDSERQIFDPALDQKTDSMFYTLGILKGVQQVADQYVLQNEMRGDLTAVNQYTETDLRRLADFSADTSCKYDSAYQYYRIINNCNYYIAHRDTMLLTGSNRVAIPEYAEALAVRAWAYLQLCKTYGSIPFYTSPLTNINEINSVSDHKDLQAVCDALVPELMKFSGTAVPSYGNISAGVLSSSSSDNQTEKTVVSARAMIPVDLILGDLFLETNQYEQAARYYFTYLKNNKCVDRQAYINPTSGNYRTLLADRMPSNITAPAMQTGAYSWESMFSLTSTNDVITYIPLAANRLRGVTTQLPILFGYDFYSTTGGSMTSSSRYMLERQIDASQAYKTLSDAQEYYYLPNGQSVPDVCQIGDMRRWVTMHNATQGDSAYAVMVKLNSANIPLYRTATVYLRLAEAINRMGYPDAAFAILKDGISSNLENSVLRGDSTDLETPGRYLQQSTLAMLKTTLPFLSTENVDIFAQNWGIHSRGTDYTRGAYSRYQYADIVGRKFEELAGMFNIQCSMDNQEDVINAVEDLICDEMALELAFEGTRFSDLTRLARHKNAASTYGSDFGSKWLARKLSHKNPSKDLTDEKNWYLPF